MSTEKMVTYTAQNTYSTLNEVEATTEDIWMVCHGLGYLSKFFINYFKELDKSKNYIVAPQAPSKYYQDKSFKYVGASWFTKVNTQQEIPNVMNYLDAVYDEAIRPHLNGDRRLILLGFSQGVSAITRWTARSKPEFSKLFLHSGGIPNELTPKDFTFLNDSHQVFQIYGDTDEYLDEERLSQEREKASNLFGSRNKIQKFSGGHHVNIDLVKELMH